MVIELSFGYLEDFLGTVLGANIDCREETEE
jgi:hypothetical protein